MQWIAGEIEPHLPNLLTSMAALASAVMEINDRYIETKFPQLFTIISIDYQGRNGDSYVRSHQRQEYLLLFLSCILIFAPRLLGG